MAPSREKLRTSVADDVNHIHFFHLSLEYSACLTQVQSYEVIPFMRLRVLYALLLIKPYLVTRRARDIES